MNIWMLARRNLGRHRIRTLLTIAGIAVALSAFCIIQTFISAWYGGVERSVRDRLVTRNAVSLLFYLPLSYGGRIAQLEGVQNVAYANWFGGEFRDQSYRFAQMAISDNYLDVYPEIVLADDQKSAWLSNRTGILIGADIAERFGLKVGDPFPIKGTIFPGDWQFTVSGIYRGLNKDDITRTAFFHWRYLNEKNRAEIGRQPDHVGIFVLRLAAAADPAAISRQVDALFANSFAETRTESETEFQRSFISMSSTIISSLQVISLVVVGIMLLVLTNTMLMDARERFREFAVLRAIGFRGADLAQLLCLESLLMAGAGFIVLCMVLAPVYLLPAPMLLGDLADFFPVLRFDPLNVLLAFGAAVIVALLAALLPVAGVMRLRVTEAMRRIG